MPLVYSFVARGTVVLAQHATQYGNFSSVAIEVLQRGPADGNRFAYTHEGHTFNFLIEGSFTFLVVADQGTGRELPIFFLEKVKEEFMNKYADKGRNGIAHSMDKTVGPRLKYWMEYCVSHPEEVSKVAAIQSKIDDVKVVMMDNIDKVIQRGENLDALVGKTDNLRHQADRFQRNGQQLRSKMWWQNAKVKVLVLVLILVLIAIIIGAACSGGGCSK